MTSPPHSSLVAGDPVPEPLSLSHFFKTLSAYRGVIFLAAAITAIVYLLIALILFLATPTERVTSQPFRLDFTGASVGQFPNGLRFSTSDVVAPAILLKVHRDNDLQRFTSFANFSRSVFVLEANRAYDTLAADYQARLSDPKLSPVDRERLLREFEQKREAVAKNEYSLNLVRRENIQKMPEPLVRKVLSDVLSTWSDHATKNQDVLAYRIAVLSPQILTPGPIEKSDLMMGAHMLRSRTVRLLENLAELQGLPGAELARAGADRLSLDEVRLRMEEIQRYRVEPLVRRVQTSGTFTASTIRFLQDQLAYDQRRLEASRRRADALRETLAVYEQSASIKTPVQAGGSPSRGGESGETVMPQLSDTFIDRMVDLVSKTSDSQYRQNLVNDYREALAAVIPLEQTVAYDTALIQDLSRSRQDGAGSAEETQAEIERAREDLRLLVTRMNEIYREISRNIYSPGQLLTLTAPAATRVSRGIDPVKVLLWGVVTMLLALPLIVIGCLLHNRVREEEEAEVSHA